MDESSPDATPLAHRASRLRIGLLVDSVMASQYVYDFATWAQSHPSLIVTHLIIVDARLETGSGSKVINFLQGFIRSASRNGLSCALSELAFLAVARFERALVKRDKHHFAHSRTLDLRPLVKHMITITPAHSNTRHRCRFDAAEVERVKALDLDLVLQCGQCDPCGEVLKASRLGIISVHCGDNRIVRGGPPGFWEVYYRQETTGFTIVRLRDDVDVGDALLRGNFATRHYYMLNQAFALRKAYYYLKLIVEKIAVTSKPPHVLPSFPYSQPLFRTPGFCNIITYLARRCYSILLKRARQMLGIHYRSTVAYVHQNWPNAVLGKGTKLTNRPLHYLADPFVVRKNGKIYCFVEDLDYGSQRGCIDVYEMTDGGGVRLGTALKEDFHLSFPYLFEYRGELYMCPESSENRSIRIYKCVEFPLQWKLETIAMKDVSAVDSMIFEKDGKWWMLTNIDTLGIGDHCSELFIFSATSPLESAWKPHSLNPVLVDASRARNAGYVVEGGRFYRCSQAQGFDFYGKRVLINEIMDLTETSYRESCSCVVTPTFGDAVGTHHLHGDGKFTVFDFVTSSRINT